MKQRDWCPSLQEAAPHSDAPGMIRTNFSKTVESREFGAAAANNDETALRVAEGIPISMRANNYWKFSSAVVASRANRQGWPKSLEDVPAAADEVASGSERLLCDSISNETALSGVSLPADCFPDFLSSLARGGLIGKDSAFVRTFNSVDLRPPVGVTVPLEDIVNAFVQNTHLVEKLERLTVSGAAISVNSSEGGRDEFETLLSTAKKLNHLSLNQCGALTIAPLIAGAFRDGTMESLSLESNDLGVGGGDAEAVEAAREALVEMLKTSKFLHTLNLAYNNFTGEACGVLLQALADSDTRLTPEDLAAKRAEAEDYVEDVEPPTVEELIDRALFFDEEDEDEESVDEEEPSEDEESADEEGAAAGSEEEEDQDGDADAEDAEEDEEDEGDEEEGGDDGEAEEDDEEGDDEEDEEKPPEPDRKELRRIRKEMRSMLKEEKTTRTGLLNEYLESLLATASDLNNIRACYAEEQRKETEAYCKRRSGWSRLRSLSLRGNALGDRGIRSISNVLRRTVTRGEEELTQRTDELRANVTALIENLQAARQATLEEEAQASRALFKEVRTERKALNRARRLAGRTTVMVVPSGVPEDDEVDDDEEHAEYQKNAEPVVLTNVEGGDAVDEEEAEDEEKESEAEEGEDGEEDEVPPEDGGWEEAATTMELHIEPTKAGMNSITYLDLSSCTIGSRGLETLASALGENETVETLILRNNAVGAVPKKGSTRAGGAAEGILALAAVLKRNTTLRNLDLGYCSLNERCLHALADGLAANGTLRRLSLEGNMFQPDEPSAVEGAADATDGSEEEEAESEAEEEAAVVVAPPPTGSALLAVLRAVNCQRTLQQLDLSNNAVGGCLWADELSALATATTTSLTHLYLSNAEVRGEQIDSWAAHMEGLVEESPGSGVACHLETLHLARSHLAGEEDGRNVGRLLAQCGQLRELNLSENTRLGSAGLAAALASLPTHTPLVWLNCDSVGATSATVVVVDDATEESTEAPVVPPALLEQMTYLSLGDLDLDTEQEELSQGWSSLVATHCRKLVHLALWGRRVDMEDAVSVMEPAVDAVSTLLFGDFGVLMRFDKIPDLQDSLGRIERTLLARRVAAASAALALEVAAE